MGQGGSKAKGRAGSFGRKKGPEIDQHVGGPGGAEGQEAPPLPRAGPSFVTSSRHLLEETLATVIREKTIVRRRSLDGKVTPARREWTRLIMKFPSLHVGFTKAKDTFSRLDTAGTGAVSLEQLQQGAETLGYRIAPEVLERVFVANDVDRSSSLDAREFVTVLAILHLLKAPEDEELIDPEILLTFQTAEEAFMCFHNGSGFLDLRELEDAMQEAHVSELSRSPSANARGGGGGGGGDPIAGIVRQRFAELNRAGDGRISFMEFLWALEAWVEDAEEEEEE